MSRKFFVNLIERAVKTFFQGLLMLGLFSAGGALSAGWRQTLFAAAGMAGLSVITSVVSSRIGDSDDPAAIAAIDD